MKPGICTCMLYGGQILQFLYCGQMVLLSSAVVFSISCDGEVGTSLVTAIDKGGGYSGSLGKPICYIYDRDAANVRLFEMPIYLAIFALRFRKYRIGLTSTSRMTKPLLVMVIFWRLVALSSTHPAYFWKNIGEKLVWRWPAERDFSWCCVISLIQPPSSGCLRISLGAWIGTCNWFLFTWIVICSLAS